MHHCMVLRSYKSKFYWHKISHHAD